MYLYDFVNNQKDEDNKKEYPYDLPKHSHHLTQIMNYKNLFVKTILLLLIPSILFAQDINNPPLNITTVNGAVSTYPYALKFPNGSLTDDVSGAIVSFSSLVDDTAFSTAWDTDTTRSASKNALYDQMSLYGLKAGDTWTGTHDFGGAVLEVPNGASPTVDAAGEIAHDTTDDQFVYGATPRVIAYTCERCFALETPVVGDDNVPVWSPNDAITITSMYCRTQGGTSAEIQISDGTNACESIVCDSDGQADDGTLTNNTFTANERMEFDTIAVTGSVTWVNYCVRYTIDRQ